jgi:tetratricopeptide (TPR) repeat protein
LENNSLRFICARLHQQNKKYAQAEQHYNDILARDPNNASALNNLADLISQDSKRLELAMSLGQKALANAPNNAQVMDTVASLYLKNNQAANAVILLEKAVKLAPGDPMILFNLIKAQFAIDNHNAALKNADSLLASFPQFKQRTDVEKIRSLIASKKASTR